MEIQNQTGQQQNVQSVRYAGFWIRFVAWIIDAIILSVGTSILKGTLFIFLAVPLHLIGLGKLFNWIFPPFLWMVLGWLYYILMTDKFQATLGKMVIGVKVISEDLNRASTGKIALRETIGKFISGFILLIGYVMAGLTTRKQALHDKIAGTVVVYKKQLPS